MVLSQTDRGSSPKRLGVLVEWVQRPTEDVSE